MDIRVYPMNIGQDGIYMGYPMYILEIGVPDGSATFQMFKLNWTRKTECET
jgi:hypothetical protein